MSKIPDKVRINGIIYDVEIANYEGNDFVSINYWGHCYHDKCKIVLNKSIDKQKLEQTFLHEIIHIINIDYELKLDEDDVTRLANGLYAFLKDNFKEIK